MRNGTKKLRILVAFLWLLVFYRYFTRRSKRAVSHKMDKRTAKDTVMETLKSISLKQLYDETAEYVIEFCKRRPIVAALIALELGATTYYELKKYSKSFIWWNTVMELEIKGDYTMVRVLCSIHNEYS